MTGEWFTRPLTLAGEFVRLEPLAPEHLSDLCAVGLEEDLWRWTLSCVRTPQEMQDYLAEALRLRTDGKAYPFATVDRFSGRAVGSTRYGSLEPAHRRLEIGWTWIAAPWQRTPANTEAKFLMLGHAFEVLNCLRVEFKTDVLNQRSRTALARIGAREEGTLRSHLITASGRVRDTIYFSILAAEWPQVKRDLQAKLRRPFPAAGAPPLPHAEEGIKG